MLATLLAQSDSSGSGGVIAIAAIFSLVFIAIYVVALWKIFEKMGQPGWYGIIPIFNFCVIAKLAGKDWWWGLLIIVPCIGWIFQIILLNELSKLFGKTVLYTVGLIFLPFIFLLILAFGSARYEGSTQKAF